MNLANKTFKDNRTGETIKVLDSFDNIAILENKEKVDVRRLMDSNLYTEQIDVNNFFNNQGAYNNLADKIKSISTENLKDDPSDIASRIGGDLIPATNESAIIMVSEDDEKAELARKYGASVDNISSTQRQNEAFAKLLGEDSDDDLPKIQPRQVQEQEQVVQRVEVNRDEVVNNNNNNNNQQIRVGDPIITMFKGVKRAVDFKMNIEVSNKIPRLDFIEMMEDSYQTSIIDFLADEFTEKLLKDPQIIKNMISDRIKQLVYGVEIKSKKESEPSKTPKKRNIPKVSIKETDKMIEGVSNITPPPKPPRDRKLKEGQKPEKPNSMK